MRALLALLLALLAAVSCSGPEHGVRPEFGPTRVVPLKNVTAMDAATELCHLLSGGAGPAGGCAVTTHCADGTHVSPDGKLTVTVDARTNTIVIAASPGCDAELERAVAALAEIDLPRTRE